MIDPETLAAENGFSHWAQMNMAAAVPLAEVRDMCAADRCGRYGHNWACPPGCGSLETAAHRIAGYACGILVQTTGTLQDDFDYATIEAVGAAHKRRFAGFARQMRRAYPGCLPLTAGSCTLCARCMTSCACRSSICGCWSGSHRSSSSSSGAPESTRA